MSPRIGRSRASWRMLGAGCAAVGFGSLGACQLVAPIAVHASEDGGSYVDARTDTTVEHDAGSPFRCANAYFCQFQGWSDTVADGGTLDPNGPDSNAPLAARVVGPADASCSLPVRTETALASANVTKPERAGDCTQLTLQFDLNVTTVGGACPEISASPKVVKIKVSSWDLAVTLTQGGYCLYWQDSSNEQTNDTCTDNLVMPGWNAINVTARLGVADDAGTATMTVAGSSTPPMMIALPSFAASLSVSAGLEAEPFKTWAVEIQDLTLDITQCDAGS